MHPHQPEPAGLPRSENEILYGSCEIVWNTRGCRASGLVHNMAATTTWGQYPETENGTV